MRPKDIAKLFNLSKQRVNYWLHHDIITKRKRREKLTRNERSFILKWAKDKPKRRRNSIGQFISSDYGEFKRNGGTSHRDKAKKKSITIFIAIFFIILASPWIALLLKSKNLRTIILGLEKFFGEHFINDDEFLGVKWTKTPNDI